MATMVEMDIEVAQGIWQTVAKHFNSEPDGATPEMWKEAAESLGYSMDLVKEMQENPIPLWDELSPAHQALWTHFVVDSVAARIAQSMRELLLVDITVVTVGTNGDGEP